jgi:gliding motility-associated-like protein
MKFYALLFSFVFVSFVKVHAACGPADFTAADTCSNTAASFIGSGGDENSVYSWDFGDPTSSDNIGTGATVTHFFASPGFYTITLTISGSCSGTITKSFNISHQAIPPISVDIKDTLVCKVPFNYTSAGGPPGATYLWSNGQTGSSANITDAGRYWVKTSFNGCSFADTAKVSIWGQGNHGDYNWNFGNAGYSFATDPFTNLPAGPVITTGSSSISDPSGKLLFYSDGQTIYDKNNVLMKTNGPNPIAPVLQGTSPAQPVLITPDPRSGNLYYVFTSGTTGLTYSMVDMSLNGGLGAIIQTNIPLSTSANAGTLAGLSDSLGGFWTVTYDPLTTQFLAYKINNSGLVTTPVTSAGPATGPSSASPGTLKFSQDGKKAAMLIPGQNLVEVFDFNRATGVFSNPVPITTPNPAGIEFAPDNSKIYIDGNQNLYQYDLTSIATPPVLLSTGANYGNMGLAPDGRIYVSLGSSGSIGIINDPTFAGITSNYYTIPSSIEVSPYLPNFIANYFTSKGWGLIYQDTCANSPTLVQFSAPDTVTSWTWSFDGVQDPKVYYPGSQTTQHTFTTAGSHTISVNVQFHCGNPDTTMSRVITIIAPPVVNLPANITVCVAGDSAKLDAGNPGSTYAWSTGETTQVIYAKTTATYSVVVTKGKCTGSGSSNVNFFNQPQFNLGNDTTLCFGQTLTLNTGSYPTATSTTWNGVPGGQTFPVSSTGQYIAAVNFASCTIKDTINVTVLPQLNASLGSDDTLCSGLSKVIGNTTNTNPAITYQWSIGSTASVNSITVTTSNDYALKVSAGQCSAADTVHIEFVNLTPVNLGPSDVFCVNSFKTLDAGNAGVPGVKYLWSPNGATTQQTTFSSGSQGPVTYSVVVSSGKNSPSGGCTVTGSVTYTYVVPPVINLGPDSKYCEGESITLDADPANSHPGFSYLWSPGGQTARSISASATNQYSVIAKQGSCFSAPATVHLTFEPLPAVTLPAEFTFCKTKQPSVVVGLVGASSSYSYLWSTSETTDAITVNQEGTYSVRVFIIGGNCPKNLTTNVISICEANLFVPSAFSPNGDGNNEIFQVYGEDIVQYDFRIFDRWGELIFVSTDLSQSWDGHYKGKVVEEGVYVWKVVYYGKTENGLSKHTKEGDVTVIK